MQEASKPKLFLSQQKIRLAERKEIFAMTSFTKTRTETKNKTKTYPKPELDAA